MGPFGLHVFFLCKGELLCIGSAQDGAQPSIIVLPYDDLSRSLVTSKGESISLLT